MSFGEFLQGAMGAAAGVAMVASDERVKTHIRDPDLRDLQDFLGNTRGKLYHYKDPKHPGRRAGLNYGPMAQDLAKSKIGRTVVVEGPGGMYVDTARLALADHAALAELARDIERLKARK
jgi:dethiobiotin synthetase